MRIIATVVGALMTLGILSSCSTSDQVPDGQVIKPSAAPSEWKNHKLETVRFSLPADWTKDSSKDPDKSASTIRFAAPASDGEVGSGAIASYIKKATRSAEDQAMAALDELRVVSEMSNDERTSIVWPGAEDAWYIAATNKIPAGKDFVTRQTAMVIADIADGSQIHLTVTVPDDTNSTDIITSVVSSLELPDEQ